MKITNKGYAKAVLVVMVLVAISSFAIYSTSVKSQPLNYADFLELESNTYSCAGTCEAVFVLKNPTGSSLVLSDSSKYDLWFDVADGSGLESFEVLREENVTYDVIVDNFGTCQNATDQWQCKTGTHKEQKWKFEWKPFDPTGKTISSGNEWKIKLIGQKKISLEPNNIDWKIRFNGFEPPWDWWNDSFKYRYQIILNDSVEDVYSVNDDNGLN